MSETPQCRYALLIAADAYTDPALGTLCAPRQDVADLARVLKAPEIGGFTDVVQLVNLDAQAVRQGISDFLCDKRRDDLLLLYFSGHGVIDRYDGNFYLAFGETEQRDAHLQAACEAFRAARAFTEAPGIVADVQRRLALLDGGFEDLAGG